MKLNSKHIIGLLILLCIQWSTLSAQCVFDRGIQGEECHTAEYICGSSLDGYVGKLRQANVTQVFWDNSAINPKSGVCAGGGQFDNTSWFSFTACSSTVHLRIHVYNCVQPQNNLPTTGIQTGLYTKCKKTNSVACQNIEGATSGIINLSYNNSTLRFYIFNILFCVSLT